MKDVRLQRLRLRNFKGIKSFDLEAAGEDVTIRGDNAVGKSTVADSLSWILYGKDHSGASDFEIKTLTPSGEPHHGLEHEVEAVLSVGGSEVKLRKVFSEKWVKSRGSAEKVHDGHTTDHYIDDVPVKAGEYKSRIAEIAPEDDAQLLTNPAYFASGLHWTKRREALIALCGDVADSEVIATDKALEAIPGILDGKTIDERRKIIAQTLSGLNKEIAELPTRIDEVSRSMPEESGPVDMDGLRAERTRLSEELTRITAGGEIAEKGAKLASAESRVIDITNEWRRKSGEGAEKQTADIDAARREVNRISSELDAASGNIARMKEDIARYGATAEGHREEWRRINELAFTPSALDTCPTCSQSLPADQVAAANDKGLADFNADKVRRLERESDQGKGAVERQTELIAEVEAKAVKVAELQDQKTIAEARLESLEGNETVQESAPLDKYPGYKEAVAARDARQAEIEKLTEDSASVAAGIREQLSAQDQAIAEAEAVAASQKQRETALERIQSLKDEERDLAAQFETLEGHKFLTEEFVKAKVALLEGRINERFELARFKMFDLLVNGGIAECCEVMVEGVPWGSLNNAARINAGLDIIRTLSEAKGLTLPVIIDNCEAIVSPLSIPAQQIALYVDGTAKSLTVERAKVEVAA